MGLINNGAVIKDFIGHNSAYEICATPRGKKEKGNMGGACYQKQANAHKAPRRKEYGSIGDQLDEIFKDIDAWKTRIQAIKDKYPKE